MAADSGTRTLVRPRRRIASLDALRGLTLVSMIAYPVSYTHLTLPTNREV